MILMLLSVLLWMLLLVSMLLVLRLPVLLLVPYRTRREGLPWACP